MKATFSFSTAVACLGVMLGCGGGSDEQPAPGNGGDSNGSDNNASSNSGGLLTVSQKENESSEYIILDTLTDQFDRAKAKANAEDLSLIHI